MLTDKIPSSTIYFVFQGDSPTSRQMTALGVYLLTSLFFVVGGMAEFAVLIFMLRRSEKLSCNTCKLDPGINNTEQPLQYTEDRRSSKSSFKRSISSSHRKQCQISSPKSHSFVGTFKDYSYKIDFTSSIIFPLTYIVFNIFYWWFYLK